MGGRFGTCRRYCVSGVAGWEGCVFATDNAESGLGIVSGMSGAMLFSCL
jgi:hypothetical protein